MTEPNIVDLARRVLGADKVGRDLNNAAAWDAVDLVLENAPALAHAVIELTAERDELAAAIACLAKTRETLPCGCETPLNAVHILDH